jgi:molecular chaperone DnaK (HSP70)
MTNERQSLQSLLTSIQVDQTFKYHLKDPHVMLQVCQSLIQKFPNQAQDLHQLMDREQTSYHYHDHRVIPEYVHMKINLVTEICQSLKIPFPLYSLHVTEFTSPLLLIETFFHENSLELSPSLSDYSLGIDIGGSNARVAVYHSRTGQVEIIPNTSADHQNFDFPIKGLSYFEILKQAKNIAERHLSHAIWKVFLCLPMDATLSDRLKLHHAAVLCHLELLGTSNSPQLTAFCYGAHVTPTEHSVVICDLGAKSLDIGYFLIEDGFVEVKVINFNDYLGVHTLDTLLFHYYQTELISCFPSLLSDDPFSSSHLMTLSEQLKRYLSTHEIGEMNCHSILETLHYQKSLTRQQFEEICQSYFIQFKEWLHHLFSHEFPSQSVDEILLVGGGSHIPALKSLFRNYLKRPIEGSDLVKDVQLFNDDEYSGVKGAALLAALRAHLIPSDREVSKLLLVDVATHDISLVVSEGLQSVIVTRGTSIPLVKSQIYTTTYDNQTAALIHIVETVREDEEETKGIHHSTTIGWFIIENLPARPQGEVRVSVVVDISSSYEVKVTAQEMESGVTKIVVLGLSQTDEITPVPTYLNQQKLFIEHCPV